MFHLLPPMEAAEPTEAHYGTSDDHTEWKLDGDVSNNDGDRDDMHSNVLDGFENGIQ